MAIEGGQELLHYRLIDKIGEGGMGVVWRAVDTTLDREVAIKVLPETLAGDPDRLVRFEREAKLLASLRHPNIAVLHGMHRAGAVHFLAMELVEGEDLAARLARGAMPTPEAIDAGIRIAEALSAAHDRGVLHRDLKPANVRIAPDGEIKVLDFGLAKAMAPEPSEHSADPALSPTLTSAGTVAGMILGTAAYMSPEQARGRPVDRRGDVWAFGCVLYEMLTGKQTFEGETVSDMIAGILTREPDWSCLPADAGPAVRRVLERCLRKDLRERTRDLGDVALDLREAIASDAAGDDDQKDASRSGAAARPARASRWWPAACAVLLVALVASVATRWGPGRGGGAGDRPAVEMTPLVDLAGAQHSGELSPDGKRLLFVTEDGGDLDIFLQRVGGENPILLTDSSPDDDFDPAFSPDGEQIAFCSDREGGGIFVMGATGESPRRVSDTGFDPAWSPDGFSLVYTSERVATPYSRASTASLWIVDVATRETRKLFDGDAVGPRYSPSGARIAYWNAPGGRRDIWTMPAAGGAPVRVTDDAATDWSPFWSPDGRFLYFVSDRGGSPDLWRVRIDERSGEVRGPVHAVTTGVARVWEATGAFAASRIALGINGDLGELATLEIDPDRERVLGDPVTIHTGSEPFEQIDLSTDGAWITYRTSGAREHVMIVRADGSERRQLTDDRFRNRGPRWSPDGRWITMYSNRSGNYELWALRPDGTGLRALTEGAGDVNDPVWSPDGRHIAVSYKLDEGGRGTGLVDLPAEGIDAVTGPLPVRGPYGGQTFFPQAWSPDGRHVLGARLLATGEWAPAVYSVDADRLDMVPGPDGTPIVNFEEGAGWLDADRLLTADERTRRAYVHDLRTKTTREIAGIPVPSDFTVGRDGRTVVLSRTRLESDIWLLTLPD